MKNKLISITISMLITLYSSTAFAITLPNDFQLTLWVKVSDWIHPLAEHDREQLKKIVGFVMNTPWQEVFKNPVIWQGYETNALGEIIGTNDYYITNLPIGVRHLNMTKAELKAEIVSRLDYPSKINYDDGNSYIALTNAGLWAK